PARCRPAPGGRRGFRRHHPDRRLRGCGRRRRRVDGRGPDGGAPDARPGVLTRPGRPGPLPRPSDRRGPSPPIPCGTGRAADSGTRAGDARPRRGMPPATNDNTPHDAAGRPGGKGMNGSTPDAGPAPASAPEPTPRPGPRRAAHRGTQAGDARRGRRLPPAPHATPPPGAPGRPGGRGMNGSTPDAGPAPASAPEPTPGPGPGADGVPDPGDAPATRRI